MKVATGVAISKTAITSPELAPRAFTYWEHFNETSANSDVRGRSYQWRYLGGVLFRTFCDPAARSPVTSADAGESWPAARSETGNTLSPAAVLIDGGKIKEVGAVPLT